MKLQVVIQKTNGATRFKTQKIGMYFLPRVGEYLSLDFTKISAKDIRNLPDVPTLYKVERIIYDVEYRSDVDVNILIDVY